MLVIGATGGTGREVIRHALRRGQRVTALIRCEADRETLPAEITCVVGDVLDPDSLHAALVARDVVVCALGVRKGQSIGTTRSTGTANLVAAMTALGARRLVAVSSVGVGSSAAAQTLTARLLWPRLVGAARLSEASSAEDAVASSSLDWTIVRAPRLVDGPASPTPAIGEDLRLPLSAQLRRSDLAAALLECTDDPSTIGKRLTALTGRAGRAIG